MKNDDIRTLLFKIEILRRQFLQPPFIKLGLTVGEGQPRILKALLTKGSMTQRELADECLIDVTTMSRTLDRLEKAGLIIRTKKPNCRRSWLIDLTKDGVEKAKEVCKIFDMADATFFKDIPVDELETLFSSLKKIEHNLESTVNQNKDLN